MATEIPGVHMPPGILERMGRWEKAEDQLQEGVAITWEILEAVKGSVAGIQLSAPFGQVELVAPFLPGAKA
jgi:homocysteine S-methyltransferase